MSARRAAVRPPTDGGPVRRAREERPPMRFMIIRKGDAETEAGVAPTAELAQAMMDYHEEMGRSLTILGGDGLQPTSKGARLKFRKGKPVVTDGPFAESKEVLAGYTLVEAESLAEVVAWAKKWPPLDGH